MLFVVVVGVVAAAAAAYTQKGHHHYNKFCSFLSLFVAVTMSIHLHGE